MRIMKVVVRVEGEVGAEVVVITYFFLFIDSLVVTLALKIT